MLVTLAAGSLYCLLNIQVITVQVTRWYLEILGTNTILIFSQICFAGAAANRGWPPRDGRRRGQLVVERAAVRRSLRRDEVRCSGVLCNAVQ